MCSAFKYPPSCMQNKPYAAPSSVLVLPAAPVHWTLWNTGSFCCYFINIQSKREAQRERAWLGDLVALLSCRSALDLNPVTFVLLHIWRFGMKSSIHWESDVSWGWGVDSQGDGPIGVILQGGNKWNDCVIVHWINSKCVGTTSYSRSTHQGQGSPDFLCIKNQQINLHLIRFYHKEACLER